MDPKVEMVKVGNLVSDKDLEFFGSSGAGTGNEMGPDEGFEEVGPKYGTHTSQ